jgi:chemosensory pili system protein ChpC
MSALPAELRVLLLRTQGGDLVLPGGAVAEILRADGVIPPGPDTPAWLAGTLDWRGRQVPMTRLGEPEGPGRDIARRSHAVICFAPGGEARLPYLAIESPSLPHMVRVTAADLGPEPNKDAPRPLFAGRPLRLNGRSAWLLDLDALEQALLA